MMYKIICHHFFFPKNTAAKAIHPFPPDKPGTKDEIFIARRIPLTLPKNAAIPQERMLKNSEFKPFALSNSELVPVIRIYKPVCVFLKNRIVKIISNEVIVIVMIWTVFEEKEKSGEINNPLVLKINEDKSEITEL